MIETMTLLHSRAKISRNICAVVFGCFVFFLSSMPYLNVDSVKKKNEFKKKKKKCDMWF